MSKTTNKVSLKCASAPCGWFSRPSGSSRRAGRRYCRSQRRSAAPARTLNEWVKKAEVDSGRDAGISAEMAEMMTALDP